MRDEGHMDKGFANALAMLIRVDEKRLQMPLVQEHETERRIRTIDGKEQGHLREKAKKFSLDGIAVVWGEEVVGSLNSCAPDVHDTRQIGRGGRAKI